MTSAPTIGLDLGGSFLKAGVVSENGGVLHRLRYAVNRSSAEAVFDAIGQALRACAAAWPECAAVGMGIPGILDQIQHRIMNSPNLHCLDRRDVWELIASVCPLPAVIDNDANCAAWGEYIAGAGKDFAPRSLVFLTVGTGIGGGIILDGRLWRGSRGYAGEPGHIVIERDGRGCNCGGRGCLETRVSAAAVVEAFAARGGVARDAEEVAQRARSGESAASGALEEVGRDLGIGIAAIINLLNPEIVAIGGGVMGAGDLLLGPAREEAGRRAFRDSFLSTRIVPASLQNDAGLVGAALLAREKIR